MHCNKAFKGERAKETTGSGAVGGVFTPTLVVEAALGWLFGTMLGFVVPTISPTAAYLIVGMGCFLAATTRAL